jgi:hypothetical protein
MNEDLETRMCHWKMALATAENMVTVARTQIANCQLLKDRFSEAVTVVVLHGGEE